MAWSRAQRRTGSERLGRREGRRQEEQGKESEAEVRKDLGEKELLEREEGETGLGLGRAIRGGWG